MCNVNVLSKWKFSMLMVPLFFFVVADSQEEQPRVIYYPKHRKDPNRAETLSFHFLIIHLYFKLKLSLFL